MTPKFFIGPMSKNVVDATIEYMNETNAIIAFIPSRRQIEFDGGYVNSWKTAYFSEYVKNKTKNIIIQRDHSGPGQGYTDDDGYQSLSEDSKYMDLIHIDPWKKYPDYKDGFRWTVNMIRYCNQINRNLKYEVGTEQSIRKFEPEELDTFVTDLRNELGKDLFSKIKYLVIQSGTSLKGTEQTGFYEKERLIKMIDVAKKHDLLSKEHNGDYISVSVVYEKFNLGLDAINIAPEFGLIETNTYLENIKKETILDKFWEVCYKSNRWKKWVDEHFNPFTQKIELIRICGHYVFNDNEFIQNVKVFCPNIDDMIKINVKKKLISMYGC